jgi:hypothetical protein
LKRLIDTESGLCARNRHIGNLAKANATSIISDEWDAYRAKKRDGPQLPVYKEGWGPVPLRRYYKSPRGPIPRAGLPP